jgi:hypothetical protein
VFLRIERVLVRCRSRWRELLLALALVAATAAAVVMAVYYGRQALRGQVANIERLIDAGGSGEPVEDAETETTSSQATATNAAAENTAIQDDVGFYVIEDPITGAAYKRPQQKRSPDFKRWTRYAVLETYEVSDRLVTGLKESKSAVIRIHPKSVQVPNIEQLKEIAEQLRSTEHHSTYVYFFLPGMELKQNPWATIFQQTNRPTSVSFDRTHVPELYQRYEQQVWEGG